MHFKTDVCIIGAGSGGVAAAYSAAKSSRNKRVLLIETNGMLGGTSTLGGVNAWEPGAVGESELHRILFDELYKNREAVIASYYRETSRPRLCAWVREDKEITYDETFYHSAKGRIIFNPWAMHRTMEKILLELGNVTILYLCSLTGVRVSGNRITEIEAYSSDLSEKITIEAQAYVDSTAEIVAARMAGCKVERSDKPNGVSQMFVVEPKGYRKVEDIPDWVKDTDAEKWISLRDPDIIFNTYPDGKLNVNTLPTMEGYEAIQFGAEAKKIAIARTYAVWNTFQKERGLDDYKISYIFPMLGVREGYRLVGKYVMSEKDIRDNTFYGKENTIAYADHSLDVHSAENKKSAEPLKHSYGIPYECCLTNEIENLAIASRGLSVSPIVASSCRLQRTIMQIGESIGKAAVLSKDGSF